ncbi:MAG: citrate synthase [Agarilytica sp.]
MPTEHKHDEVRSRDENFSERVATRIWKEVPSDTNPYVAKGAHLHGYDIRELANNKSFVDVFFLLFRGELPSIQEKKLLETMMVLFINPGPRHPATRAAMNAGVGKTNVGHILPIGSSLLGGDYLGGGKIEKAMRFFRKNSKKTAQEVFEVAHKSGPFNCEDGMIESLPGFGRVYGDVDQLAEHFSSQLSDLSEEKSALRWGCELSKHLNQVGYGWMIQGVASAIFSDLGFQPRSGVALFQLISAPGVVAHGLELSNKPITAMPYISDDNYVIEKND